MGQSRALTKLRQLMNQVPTEYSAVHGYIPEEAINNIIIVPKPATYDLGLINEYTGTPKPDKMTSITGTLEEVVVKLEEFLNKIKGESKENS